MWHKDFIKLFLPPVFILLKNKIKLNKKSNQRITSTVKQIEKKDDILIVVGNGPSLTESIEKYKEQIVKHECIVVNHFCETDYYTEIKPRYYLLADPAFFGEIEKYADWLREKINRFYNAFITKTTWDINLIVPSNANGCMFVKSVQKNKFIHVYYYNTNYVSTNGMTKFELWDRNLLPPPAQTCLNTCVWLGVFLRYKELYLIGADTTWIELLHVDQKTNEVYSIDSHFYGKIKRPLYADVDGKMPVKLHNELSNISNALSLYWELRDYAEYAGVKVYNASEYSLIDAFKRKKMTD